MKAFAKMTRCSDILKRFMQAKAESHLKFAFHLLYAHKMNQKALKLFQTRRLQRKGLQAFKKVSKVHALQNESAVILTSVL